MTEEANRKWTIIIRVLTLIGLLGGGLWTVYTYREGRTKDENSVIFDHQARLYFDMTRAAATIAIGVGPDPDQRREIDKKTLLDAEARFEQLYFGEMVTVEDRRVELAVLAFRDCWQSKGRNCKRES